MNIKIGLAGNPNVGKTTLFNQLTGLHQHVGNWPGKTVEKAEGHLNFENARIDVIDLPGNYALSAHSIEEIVSRDFIVDESSDVIVNILDANNLERNLYLTTQMMELGANLVIAVNMNKFAKKRDYIIDLKELSTLTGVPVVEIEATDDTGKKELLRAIKNAAANPINSSKKLVYGTELKEHLDELKKVIEKDPKLLELASQNHHHNYDYQENNNNHNYQEHHNPQEHHNHHHNQEYNQNNGIDSNGSEFTQVSSHWIAIKLLENDKIIEEKVKESKFFLDIFNEVKKVKKHFKDLFKESSEEVIANYRYAFIEGLLNEVVTKPQIEKSTMTEKIDKIVTNRLLGIPIFAFLMWLTFQITFTVGAPFQDLLDQGFGLLGDSVLALLGETTISSFIVDGLIGGVGGVLVFIPQIFLMFLMISILEDSGYLARAAFVMDRVMHKLVGLHGKSFIPMILGFGCGVPGIMATRTMEHERDRLLTMLIVPFMSCTARLPVYALFIAAFFTAAQGEILFSLYFLGIIVAIIIAAILKKSFFKGITSPFVMELPSYKLPTLKGVLIHTLEKCWGFVKKAGTIILVASIVVWILSSFAIGPAGIVGASEYGTQETIIGQIGTVISPIFAPLGFGEWQPSVALLFGVVAKEVVVGTFSSLFSVAEEGTGITTAMQGIFTPLTAYAFMVFVLLYVPCFAALGTVKQESNSWKWPIVMVVVTTVTAYIISFLVYHIGLLLGFG